MRLIIQTLASSQAGISPEPIVVPWDFSPQEVMKTSYEEFSGGLESVRAASTNDRIKVSPDII